MSNPKYHLRSMLLTALGYDFGFALGNAFSQLILSSGLVESIRDLFAAQRLALGISLFLFGADRWQRVGFFVQLTGPSQTRRKTIASVQVHRLVQTLKTGIQGSNSSGWYK